MPPALYSVCYCLAQIALNWLALKLASFTCHGFVLLLEKNEDNQIKDMVFPSPD